MGRGLFRFLLLLLISDSWLLTPAFSQQPQTGQYPGTQQPVYPVNAKYVNGVAPGYWPTKGGGLTLNVSAGTVQCGNPPASVSYAGGTLTMMASTTTLVYLDPTQSCSPASIVPISSAPAAPTLSEVSGGSLAATTYYVEITYVNPHGETTASSESSLAVSANYLLRITSPPFVPGATGWNVYIATASGQEEEINSAANGGAPVAIGTSYTIPTVGIVQSAIGIMWYLYNPPPTSNSTGFAPGEIPIASVITGASVINSITDLRTWSVDVNANQGPNLRVDLLPGANLGAKWATCLAALPPSGGGCDMTRITGAQSITSNPYAGITKPTYSTIGPAAITTVPIAFPAVPGTSLRGVFGSLDGGSTLFIPSAQNAPVFTGPTAPGVTCDQCYLGFVVVQAHPSGSTGPAIDVGGFRFSTFENISYLTHPNGTGNFNSFFHFSSYPNGYCYGNRLLMPSVSWDTGPTTVFLFDNGGSGSSSYNANIALIDTPIILENTGITTIFNLQRSGGVTVRGGIVEQNSSSTILIPGTGTIFEEVWIEGSGYTAVITPQTATDGLSNLVTFRNNLVWVAASFTIPSWSSDWTITGNEPAANLSVTDNGTNDLILHGATSSTVQKFSSGLSIGGGPTVKAVYAATATLTFSSISAQACQEQSMTVAGATTSANQAVTASPQATLGNVGLTWSAWGSASNTVAVRVCNVTSGPITPSAVTWAAEVAQF